MRSGIFAANVILMLLEPSVQIRGYAGINAFIFAPDQINKIGRHKTRMYRLITCKITDRA